MLLLLRKYILVSKKGIIKEKAGRYLRAKKKEKTLQLNDLCEISHLSRPYIARLLRALGRVKYYKGAKLVADLSSERIHRKRNVVGCISSIERFIKPYRDQAKMKGSYNGLDRVVGGEKQNYDMGC